MAIEEDKMNSNTTCFCPKVNTVSALTDQIYMIQKDGISIYVAHHKNIAMIIDEEVIMPDKLPFCALIHTFETDGEAYDKCMFLIGKMCKKDITSKYFRFHEWKEHLKNGNFEHASMEEITTAVKEVKETIDEFYRKVAR